MPTPDAERVVAAATRAGRTIGVAESLTGGDVCRQLVEVPGASAVLRGGVVAYALGVKATVLNVDPDILDTHGPVSEETARAMAAGVRELLGADIGISTTGAAGPESHGGKPPGTAFVAVDAGGGRVHVREVHIEGSREQVCAGARDAALDLAAITVEQLLDEGAFNAEQA